MVCAVVQTTGVFGSSVTSITSPAITTTTGNLIHIGSSAFSSTGHDMVASDSKSNTYAGAVAQHLYGNSATYMQSDYAKNITGGSSHTFTITTTTSAIMTLAVTEISGADITAPLDLTQSGSDASTTSPSLTTAGTTAQADEIALGELGNYVIGGASSPPSGWTSGFGNFNTGGGIYSANKVLSATGTVTFNPATTGGGFGYNLQITTYKAAAGGGGGTTPTPYFYRTHIAGMAA